MNWFEKGWYGQHNWIYGLLPLSGLFWLLSLLRRWLFKIGLKKSHKLPVPVVVVGNITVGGTGKTPFVIWLVAELQKQGFKPGVINRGYGSELGKINKVVSTQDTAQQVGDEAKLIALNSKVPVAVGRNRIKSANLLMAQGCNILVCDDGLQHYKLQRDLEIILIDGSRQLGNHCLLPSGPLREGKWRLSSTPFVIQNGSQPTEFSKFKFATQALPPKPILAGSVQKFDLNLAYYAVCGIGNPNRFYQTLNEKNIQLLEKYSFIDHHQFTLKDFDKCTGAGVIMTEKDAVKCYSFAQPNWWFLPITIKPDPEFIRLLLNQLTHLRNQYGI
ncbi:tetraacyldisaccharide 4'-kinase [Catenovulum sp. 2E275]|uniref:tetraacyldisaccharide 4'-kinase n=1 Tax=Catenovulum sp. 2E275 TaxID=2980497 RepID=UPI0021D1307B|nr:tetraacyldisaccharide 4'-kinase [Catenovulum sp. 2E275]MCU4675664.1 tetraacyldisaccharide 4'-kinase [Catenovulum sp. 2E275]